MAGARNVGDSTAERRAGRRDVKHLIADRDADAKQRIRRGSRAKNAIRQILDWKIAIRRVSAFDKAAPGRIVGLVEGLCHMMSKAFCYVSGMDSQSASPWAIRP